MNNDYYQDFMTHRRNAKKRNIEFALTYEEWLNIWQQSGKLEYKGRTKGSYNMCRYGDIGPYAVGNVYIDKAEVNAGLATLGKPKSIEQKLKMSKAQKGIKKTKTAIKNNAIAQLSRPKYNCPHCNKVISGMGNVKQHTKSKHGIAA